MAQKSAAGKTFYYVSLFHVVYSLCSLVTITAIFTTFYDDVMRFWNRYKSDKADARWVFSPVLFVAGWTAIFTFAVWDYCALGASLTVKYDYVHSRAKSGRIWWIRHGVTNERLAESCHGFCDHRVCRLIILAVRMAISSILLSISGMTAVSGWSGTDSKRPLYEVRAYTLAEVALSLTLLELPLSIFGSVFHSVYTYYMVRNIHRIEVMAISLTADNISEQTE